MGFTPAAGVRLRSGRYELVRRLGAGGAATVWLAEDTVLERQVAIKILAESLVTDTAWLARFRREARLAAGLQHPNLVSIYDFDADTERPYLVMAYLPGGSLDERLDSGEHPDPEALARDVLAALATIHAAGIVHRDVKPGNVLLTADGRACLTDFGIARPEDATSITQVGQIPGTAHYMAPELWRGEPATERSDLFATGMLLAKLAGPGSPARLTGLVERLQAADPAQRPASADEALDLLGAEEDVATTRLVAADEDPPPLPRPDPVPSHRRWLPIAALGAVLVLAGVALVQALGGEDDSGTNRNGSGKARERAQAREEAAASAEGTGQQDPPEAAETEAADTPAAAGADPVALNDQGFALIREGRYDEAIPPLQQAVDSYPEGSRELQYGYALFNLARALRLAGRPAEAVPLLEERLEIPNQTEAVEAELKQAKKDAKEAEKEDGD